MKLQIQKLAQVSMVILCLTGCLQTREDVKAQEDKEVLQTQVVRLQKTNADATSRFQEMDEEYRKLNGRVEVSETKFNQLTQKFDRAEQGNEARWKETTDRLAVYREVISKLEGQVSELSGRLAQMEESQRRAAAAPVAAPNSSKGGKNTWATAEELFEKKNWKEAILEYERYRKTNPKAKNVANATYKIGVCFQELGMPEEAKPFYDEVLAKFPGTTDATKAQTRLKGLKKK